MGNHPLPLPCGTNDPPTIVEGAVVDLVKATTEPLPAIRMCICGNVTARGHGFIPGHNPMPCEDVLDIRQRIAAFDAMSPWARWAFTWTGRGPR